MGLDMYAARKIAVKNWDFEPVSKRYSVQITQGGKPVPGILPERIAELEEEVMYWRKANQIHKWFVGNVQGGEDNCASYRVGWDQMRELLKVCKKVLKASKLVDGMIVNGTVYDKEHPNGKALVEPGKVIRDPTVAEQLLPTTVGFFFGSTEYDEYYLDNVKETQEWAERMLADHEAGVPGDIYYHSSW